MEEEKSRIESENFDSVNCLRANLNRNHGLPINYRYLLVTTDEYEKYYKGNFNF